MKIHSISTGSLIVAVLSVFLLSACKNSQNYTGEGATIDDKYTLITFQAGGGYTDVTFEHKKHSEEYCDNNCFECHNHTDVRDQSVWSCGDCHSEEDAENLCANDADGHDCMYVQCYRCHLNLPGGLPDPTPNCSDCHQTISTGLLVDSPVEGVVYMTPTHRGATDAYGTFHYVPGETVTFYVGDVVVGRGSAKAFVTPIDMVPGATDEFNQTVTNIARFLQSLDDDGDISAGITIPNTILNIASGRSVPFNVTTQEFEGNTDLQAILTGLGATLVSEDSARTHLRATIDGLFPPPAGCKIVALQSSPLAFTGSATSSGTYDYQWYRADTLAGGGKTAIAGATATTYQPTAEDMNKYLILEVAPSGTTVGTIEACGPVYPINENTLSIYGSIDNPSQIDKYSLQLTATANVNINVLAFEGCGGKFSFDFFANGVINDRLRSDLYLFTSGGAVVQSSVGMYHDNRPGAHDTDSAQNPYIDEPNLAAGNYVLAIGADVLSESDAWVGFNNDGSAWTTDGKGDGTLTFNNYKIIFTFN